MSQPTGKSMVTRVVLIAALLLAAALLYSLCGIERSTEAPQTAAVDPSPSEPADSASVAAPVPVETPTPVKPSLPREAVPVGSPAAAATPRAEIATTARPTPRAEPTALPDAPTPAEPAAGARLIRRMLPAEIEFAWENGSGADGYLIEIARDPEFREVVGERRVAEPRFRHGNLPAGTYHWRVTGTLDGAPGPRGTVSSFEIVHDDEPPPLEVAYPTVPVNGDTVLLSGSTEPGALVFHDDDRIPTTETGSFELQVALERGVNLVILEAIDPAGNVAYRTQMIATDY